MPSNEVRAPQVLHINGLTRGHSVVRLETSGTLARHVEIAIGRRLEA